MFKFGDRVKIINMPPGSIFAGLSGLVKSKQCMLPPLHKRYVVTFDVILTGDSACFDEHEHELEPIASSLSAAVNYANYMPLGLFPDLGAAAPGLPPAPQSSLTQICAVQGHQWRPYMGLNEHYDFCEAKGCEQKRPFTGKR